jgi:phosphoribosylformylglycinamidine cyclo-ligase
MTNDPMPPRRYREAGVNLEASAEAMQRMASSVRSTHGPEVLAGFGAFGGLYDAARLGQFAHPVLAATTDGVGTKTAVAAELGRFESLGYDIVHHCINDLLAQGAKPLFFLDYLAMGKLEPQRVASIVQGIADACRQAGVALLGGETAEMPGVYADDQLDVVGTLVGVVERSAIVDGSRVRAGDLVIGLASTGLHTNGFSLARRALAGRYHEPLGDSTVGDALLKPHRSYLRTLEPLLAAGLVKAMAHITGGGLPGNLPRSLPAGLGARLDTDSWPRPPIFAAIQRYGEVSEAEMFEVFNMGIGYVMVIAPEHLDTVSARLADVAEKAYPIGEVTAKPGIELLGV